MRQVARTLGLACAALAGACSLARAEAPLPTPAGYVSDFAGVIDAATEAAITTRVRELERKTGAEIAVVTIDTTAPETTFDYAMRLAEAWKPGAHDKDNGVLFLVAVRDRSMFIVTGYGIEGALPDGRVGEIRDRDVLPRFRAGDVSGGTRAGVERMAEIIAKEYGVTLDPVPASAGDRRREPRPQPDLDFFFLMLLFSFFVLSMLWTFLAQRRRRGGFADGTMWSDSFGGGGFGGPGGGFGGFGGGSGGGDSGGGGFGGGDFGGGGAGGEW